MKTTGKFDKKGNEIVERDRVMKAWGWFQWKKSTKTNYQIHTSKVKKAHKMANGKMHDDGG